MTARSEELLQSTVRDDLARQVREHPDKVFVIDGDQTMTYAEVDRRSSALAVGLLGLGLRRGDNVATWLPTCVEWIVTELALARIGVVNVLANTRYQREEIRYILEMSDAKALIFEDAVGSADLLAHVEALVPAASRSDGIEPTRLDAFSFLEHLIRVSPGEVPGTHSWSAMVDRSPTGEELDRLSAAEAEVRPDDVMYILFTSGTTGIPKGSMSGQAAVLKNSYDAVVAEGGDDRTRLLCFLPLYHCFGAVRAVFGVSTHGATIVLEREFVPTQVLEDIARYGITTIYGVPTNLILLLEAYRERGGAYDLTSWTRSLVGGGALFPDLATAILEELEVPYLCNGYGMTEATAVISQTRWDWTAEERVSSVGIPVPGCEWRTVRPGGDEACPLGEPGEVQLRGYNIHQGYYKLSASESGISEDGWFSTGDTGVLDEVGRLRILGRSKDMYKTSGFNVYPAEIEAVLRRHPKIADVAIIGVPDPTRLEVGVAFVLPEAGQDLKADEVLQFLQGKVAKFKFPSRVVVVEEFPRSEATQKIQKHRLRERYDQLEAGQSESFS